MSDLWISIANGTRRAQIEAKVLALEGRFLNPERISPDKGNGDGRVFPFTDELRTVLKAQHTEHERLKKAGHIVPQVLFREVAKGRGGETKPQRIVSFAKAWRSACGAAGCPGRIPHDLRRTAVRGLVRAGIPERVADADDWAQDASVFERYDIVSPGDLRVAVERLDAAAG